MYCKRSERKEIKAAKWDKPKNKTKISFKMLVRMFKN
jgi:hypothetical protein